MAGWGQQGGWARELERLKDQARFEHQLTRDRVRYLEGHMVHKRDLTDLEKRIKALEEGAGIKHCAACGLPCGCKEEK